MKRALWIKLVLFLLCIVLLAACGSGKVHPVTGLVTGSQTNDSGDLTALVVQVGDKEIGVLLTDKTYVFPEGDFSGTAEELRGAFQAAVRPDVMIGAECAPRKKKLTTDDGTQITAYQASYVYIVGRIDRGAVTMKDGTPVDMAEERGAHIYQLADGTELLRVETPQSPEHSYTGGVETFDSLTEAARERVLAYYEQRGLLYDEQEELEKAYALYQRREEDGFVPCMVDQRVTPSASSDRVFYLLTTVTLPFGEQGGQVVYEVRVEDAFDRETGEWIDPWDLFTVPKDTVIRTLLDKSGIEDPALRDEMAAASWDGRVVLRSDGLSVQFEPGSLPSQQHSTGFGLDYDADIKAMIQDWAIPKSTEQT